MSASLPRPDKGRSRYAMGLAGLLLVAYAGQCVFSMLDKSATYDEQVYVLAGLGYLETGEYCLKQDAPPLIPLLSGTAVKLYEWAGHPLQWGNATSSEFQRIRGRWRSRDFGSTDEYYLATEFFRNNEGPRLIQVARIPIVMIGVLLGWILFLFARDLCGDLPALVSLLLFATDPNLIGHGRVVSADLGFACFFLMSHYFFWRCIGRGSAWDWAGFAVAVGLCVGVKLSGLLVFPSLALLTLAFLAWPPTRLLENADGNRAAFGRGLLRKAVPGALLALLGGLGIVVLLYGDLKGPTLYWQSTRLIYSNVPAGYNSYLMGAFQPSFWHYYFLATLFKTPVPTLVLFGMSLIWTARGSGLRAIVLIPLLVLYGVGVLDEINIGLRRVLPAIPLMQLSIAGLVVAAGKATPGFSRWALRGALATGCGAALFVAATTFPHHLSFFGRVWGGPSQGYRYLAESNVSWGQNLPALARYLEKEGIQKVRMRFYGNDARESYGIRDLGFTDYEVYWPLQSVYVLSTHSVIQHGQTGEQGGNWFERFEPSAVIGQTLYVYDLRDFPQGIELPPERSLEIARAKVASEKYPDSVLNFQAYLRAHPEDVQVHRELAEAAEAFGHQRLAQFHREKIAGQIGIPAGEGLFFDED